jgi:hypothetical protein
MAGCTALFPTVPHRLQLAAHGLAVLLVAASTGWASSDASAATSQLHVAARVKSNITLRPLSTPSRIEITAEDTRRGFVDVPEAMAFTVRCNLLNGIGLHVQMDPALVAATTVSGLGRELRFAGPEAVLQIPGPHRVDSRYDLHWRIQLMPNVQPGVYAWPFSIDVQGL